MSPLPGDLELLGAELEAATARDMRRRTRRHALATSAGAILVSVPLAVAVSAVDVAHDDRRPPVSSAMPFVPTSDSDAATRMRRLGEDPSPARPTPCPDAADCRPPSTSPAYTRRT
ncbi:MAG TPA: hypothetical protein VN213_00590 [Solirubrobacteraceae bacterium]|nr:hypothetical protein [Solirubrobacteraceae bacterium]